MTSKTKSRWGYLRQVTGLALGVVVVMGIVACDDGVIDVEEIDNAAILCAVFRYGAAGGCSKGVREQSGSFLGKTPSGL